MFIIILSLLYTVCAQRGPPVSANSDDSPHVYSRTYLRGLKRVENERIQAEFINSGITYIEHSVFTAAKRGLLSFTTETFHDCETDIYEPSKLEPYGNDKAVCENIVNGIKKLVHERFPDSEILYDATTKRYTLKWD
jgi:hypothetical protein